MPDLATRYGVGRLWIFGSRVSGADRASSDLDLLVEFDRRGISLFGFSELELLLESRLGLTVDLVEREALRPDFRAQVLSSAVLV